MEIQLAQDAKTWNDFLLANPRDGLFLQSWEWGELLEKTGQSVKRLQVVENGVVVTQVQLVMKQLPFQNFYALAGKGPVTILDFRFKISEFYDELTRHLRSKKCVFLRFEPQSKIENNKSKIRMVRDINPPATLVLDIAPTEDALLARMHEKTRYNIRLAEKKGLQVTEEKNFDIFWNLLQKTGERDDFTLHSRASYEAIMNSDAVKQIIVWRGETPVATAGLIGFGDTMYYLYGASDHAYRNLMGPHLMQWEAIKLAKKLGYKKYDFFGISPRARHPEEVSESPLGRGGELVRAGVGLAANKSAALGSPQGRQTPPNHPLERGGGYTYDPNHRYAGVTRFKFGFGGEVHEESGTFDLIIDTNKYRVYQALRKLRSLF